ncbi:MAG TPA: hypothetical protein VF598_02180 [Hymenobacter sp.]
MLRIALLFICLLGFASADVHAASAGITKGPLHKRKPMAGNYRPVYKKYRGPGRQRKIGGAQRHTSGQGGLFARSRRGTL